jgi:hypothetical protein
MTLRPRLATGLPFRVYWAKTEHIMSNFQINFKRGFPTFGQEFGQKEAFQAG